MKNRNKFFQYFWFVAHIFHLLFSSIIPLWHLHENGPKPVFWFVLKKRKTKTKDSGNRHSGQSIVFSPIQNVFTGTNLPIISLLTEKFILKNGLSFLARQSSSICKKFLWTTGGPHNTFKRGYMYYYFYSLAPLVPLHGPVVCTCTKKLIVKCWRNWPV